MIAPNKNEIMAARVPHNIFLTNLIMNHILLLTAVIAFGAAYIKLLVLVPLFSLIALGYTLYRSGKIKREQSGFVYIHWQIARRWSVWFAGVIILAIIVTLFAWLIHQYLGIMKAVIYALVAGFAFLPIMVFVILLIIIESDSLYYARTGRLPKWAQKRFLADKTD